MRQCHYCVLAIVGRHSMRRVTDGRDQRRDGQPEAVSTRKEHATPQIHLLCAPPKTAHQFLSGFVHSETFSTRLPAAQRNDNELRHELANLCCFVLLTELTMMRTVSVLNMHEPQSFAKKFVVNILQAQHTKHMPTNTLRISRTQSDFFFRGSRKGIELM